jgi:4-diphosphocytidyl-2-C-methyl-D-erythritol kinase
LPFVVQFICYNLGKERKGDNMNAAKEKAYAKINLYLDCLGIRDDGFHEIKTVMHSVTLADTVTVVVLSRDKRNIRLQLVGNRYLPTDSKNLAYSAAALFMERAAIDADILIKLEKHIPVSAGLAGGSTDAAATLRALNRLFGKRFSDKALLAMAAELGSDVPYCLVGGTALLRQRGGGGRPVSNRLCGLSQGGRWIR